MPNRPPIHRPRRIGRDYVADKKRGTSRERGYDARWTKFAKHYLVKHPLCVKCMAATGQPVSASDVDHVKPLNDGGPKYDYANLQALCHACHSKKTARENGWVKRSKFDG